MNFFKYLAAEENNLLTSLHDYRKEFDYFNHLDGLFQAAGQKLKVGEKGTLIALFSFTHFHLYFSVAAIYRMHASECWVSNRKAIDAILSAYRIIEEPGSQ